MYYSAARRQNEWKGTECRLTCVLCLFASIAEARLGLRTVVRKPTGCGIETTETLLDRGKLVEIDRRILPVVGASYDHGSGQADRTCALAVGISRLQILTENARR